MNGIVTYTCGTYKDGRGNCGKRHRTVEAAQAHCNKDRARCEKAGVYFDRTVVVAHPDRRVSPA
jgi:hypothetical protein